MKEAEKMWAFLEWGMTSLTEVTQKDINLKSTKTTETKRNNSFRSSLKQAGHTESFWKEVQNGTMGD